MNILELRKQTGLSQSQFAKKFNIKLKTLQSWEQGWRNCPEHITYMIEEILRLENNNAKEKIDNGIYTGLPDKVLGDIILNKRKK